MGSGAGLRMRRRCQKKAAPAYALRVSGLASRHKKWDDTTEAQGGAEEAHRRWPEGRSEQGASKAKDLPPGFDAHAPLKSEP